MNSHLITITLNEHSELKFYWSQLHVLAKSICICTYILSATLLQYSFKE